MMTNEIRVKAIKFTQPAGPFYFFKLKAIDTVKIASPIEREYEEGEANEGIERRIDIKRVKAIKDYLLSDPDALFPTPIIVAATSEAITIEEDQNDRIDIIITKDKNTLEIVDGQHRVQGLKETFEFFDSQGHEHEARERLNEMELPIVAILDVGSWEKALVFSKINGNQKPVSKSMIYDLFLLSPNKYDASRVAANITKALNFDNGPLYHRIKMLGTKTKNDNDHFNETISQGTFADELKKAINKEGSLLGELLEKKEDEKIYKIIFNIFEAVEKTWPEEWKNKKLVLSKSVGVTAILRSIESIEKLINKKRNFKTQTISVIFAAVKEELDETGKNFSSESFPSSSKGANELKKIIESAVRRVSQE